MTTTNFTPAYQHLLTTGMARWVPALMILLPHYEGIERALEPEEMPLNYLAEQLEQIGDTPMADRERLFFNVVATMPLFYYRVAGNGKSWNLRMKHSGSLNIEPARSPSGKNGRHTYQSAKLKIGCTLTYRFQAMLGLRRKPKPPHPDCLRSIVAA